MTISPSLLKNHKLGYKEKTLPPTCVLGNRKWEGPKGQHNQERVGQGWEMLGEGLERVGGGLGEGWERVCEGETRLGEGWEKVGRGCESVGRGREKIGRGCERVGRGCERVGRGWGRGPWATQRQEEFMPRQHPHLLGAPKWGGIKWAAKPRSSWILKGGGVKLATPPLPSRDALHGKESEWPHNQHLRSLPKCGGIKMATLPLPWWGSQSGKQERCPIKPSLLRVPKTGRNQMGCKTKALLDPKEGRYQSGCITAAFSGSPRWGGIQVAASPLPSRGPQHGERIKVDT